MDNLTANASETITQTVVNFDLTPVVDVLTNIENQNLVIIMLLSFIFGATIAQGFSFWKW